MSESSIIKRSTYVRQVVLSIEDVTKEQAEEFFREGNELGCFLSDGLRYWAVIENEHNV